MSKSGIAKLPLIPIRAEASSKSELVSQLLFGEVYEVIEQVGDWYKIENQSDSYIGWINKTQFSVFLGNEIPDFVLNKFPYTEILLEGNSSPFFVFPGSKIFNSLNGNFSLDGLICQIKDEKDVLSVDLITYSKYFLNSPYLWGGKSFAGIDCSGFTQVVFSCFGLILPRDAYQQAEIGEKIDFVTSSIPGDLAFFENQDGLITHVGIVIENQQIIHASGKVRVDLLDSFGIFNPELGIHTHQLRIIKRIKFKTN
jgi:hypothetical protein